MDGSNESAAKRDPSGLRARKLLARCHREGVPPAARGVLLTLCAHEDADGLAFPAQALLYAECGITNRPLYNAIAQLEAAGIVKKESRPKQGGGSSNLYKIVSTQHDPDPDTAFAGAARHVNPAMRTVYQSTPRKPRTNVGRASDQSTGAQVTGSLVNGSPVTQYMATSDPVTPAPVTESLRSMQGSMQRSMHLFPGSADALPVEVQRAASSVAKPRKAKAPKADKPPLPFRAERASELVKSTAATRYTHPLDDNSGKAIIAKGLAIAIERHARRYPDPERWTVLGAWFAAGGLFRTDLGPSEIASAKLPQWMTQSKEWHDRGRPAISNSRPGPARSQIGSTPVIDHNAAETERRMYESMGVLS